MAETIAQNVNNITSYADAAKQHTIFRDCSDQLSGVKPIFLVPTEVYRAVGQHFNVSNMIGLQRVCGLWRICLDNQEDRELLLSSTLVLRNKSVNFYTRNPRYAFKEKTDTTKVRVKDIPLSADDGQIIKAL